MHANRRTTLSTFSSINHGFLFQLLHLLYSSYSRDHWGFHQLLVFKDKRLILFKKVKKHLFLKKNNAKMVDFTDYDTYRNEQSLLIPKILFSRTPGFYPAFWQCHFITAAESTYSANSKAHCLFCLVPTWHLFIDFILVSGQSCP